MDCQVVFGTEGRVQARLEIKISPTQTLSQVTGVTIMWGHNAPPQVTQIGRILD